MKYQYSQPGSSFKYEELKTNQSTIKKKVETYQESKEVKFEHVYQQLMNDIYEKIEEGESLSLQYIEKHLIINLLQKFNKTHTAKIMKISIRTLRNKVNLYGLKDLRPH